MKPQSCADLAVLTVLREVKPNEVRGRRHQGERPKEIALCDSGGEDEGRSIGQASAPAGGLAQGVPGDAADQALAGPGEVGEPDALQELPQ